MFFLFLEVVENSDNMVLNNYKTKELQKKRIICLYFKKIYIYIYEKYKKYDVGDQKFQ